jgi:NAD(P)-dependent dehydrogenase (short-subunit alcohol dehydrogenase family)
LVVRRPRRKAKANPDGPEASVKTVNGTKAEPKSGESKPVEPAVQSELERMEAEKRATLLKDAQAALEETRNALDALDKGFGAKGGSIINLSSIVGSHPVAGALLYASTKGAIETLTKGLALELAPLKIRVNAIAPGHTETEGNIAAGTFDGGAGEQDTARPARSRH